MTKTIGKDSVVIITTKQAEVVNKVHIKMLDSISVLRSEAYALAYYKLETMDKLYDLENEASYYKAYTKIKEQEVREIKTKNKNQTLIMMLIMIGWTLYTGINTQTLK